MGITANLKDFIYSGVYEEKKKAIIYTVGSELCYHLKSAITNSSHDTSQKIIVIVHGKKESIIDLLKKLNKYDNTEKIGFYVGVPVKFIMERYKLI